jgi:hypothetical protein
MRLLVSSGDVEGRVRGDVLDVEVDLACEEAFQAADRVAFGVAGGDASLEVREGRCVSAAGPDHDDGPERGVGVAVTGSVESSSLGVAAGDGDGGGATERREAGFGSEPVGIVAGGAHQGAGGVVADTVAGEERRGDGVEDDSDGLVEFLDLVVERGPSACDGDQRPFGATGRGKRISGAVATRDPRLCDG